MDIGNQKRVIIVESEPLLQPTDPAPHRMARPDTEPQGVGDDKNGGCP